MNKLIVLALLSLLSVGGMTLGAQAEEKVEVKEKSNDGSWKMNIKRKNDKEWEGVHEGKTYSLRGDTAFTTVKDDGDYTVYGTMAPDSTYITTTRVERLDVREAGEGREKREAGEGREKKEGQEGREKVDTRRTEDKK
jgi:hypothetical protein